MRNCFELTILPSSLSCPLGIATDPTMTSYTLYRQDTAWG